MDFDWKPVIYVQYKHGGGQSRQTVLMPGMVVRGGGCEGVIVVGDIVSGGHDGGCGCCSYSYYPTEWAWIPGFGEG